VRTTLIYFNGAVLLSVRSGGVTISVRRGRGGGSFSKNWTRDKFCDIGVVFRMN